jgi:hypothetical protein
MLLSLRQHKRIDSMQESYKVPRNNAAPEPLTPVSFSKDYLVSSVKRNKLRKHYYYDDSKLARGRAPIDAHSFAKA